MTWNTESITATDAQDGGGDVDATSSKTLPGARLSKLRPRSFTVSAKENHRCITIQTELCPSLERSPSFQRSSWYRKPIRRSRSVRRTVKTPAPVVQTSDNEDAVERPLRASSAREPSIKPQSLHTKSTSAAASLRASQHIHTSKRYSVHTPQRARPARPRRRRRPHVQQWRRPRKVVVVGDMCSGKSGLISAYCRDRFSERYVPTMLRSCLTNAKVFGQTIDLVVVEVAGRDDYARLRRCAYHKMDAVILCYSADNIESLERIKKLWLPELRVFAPKVPYILVGTKKDVREDIMYQFELEQDTGYSEELANNVSTHHGSQVARSIGAHGFVECSALYRDGTREVFETAAKVALRKSRRKKKCSRNDPCIIL